MPQGLGNDRACMVRSRAGGGERSRRRRRWGNRAAGAAGGRGPPPRAGYVWAPGYWRRSGQRYVWIDGRWVRERRGYQSVPEQWVAVGPRWHFGTLGPAQRPGWLRTSLANPLLRNPGEGCALRQAPSRTETVASLGQWPAATVPQGVSLCRRSQSALPNRANRRRRALGRSLLPRSDHGKLLACQYPLGPLDCLIHLPNGGLTQEI